MSVDYKLEPEGVDSALTFKDAFSNFLLKSAFGLLTVPFDSSKVILQVQVAKSFEDKLKLASNLSNYDYNVFKEVSNTTLCETKTNKAQKRNKSNCDKIYKDRVDIIKNLGFAHLYSGVSSYCLETASHSILVDFFENLLFPELYVDNFDSPVELQRVAELFHFSSLIFSHLLASVITSPIALIYSRILLSRNCTSSNRSKSFLGTFFSIYNEEGFRSFYAGFLPAAAGHIFYSVFNEYSDFCLEYFLGSCLHYGLQDYKCLYFFGDVFLHLIRIGLVSVCETVSRRLYLQKMAYKASFKNMSSVTFSNLRYAESARQDYIVPICVPFYNNSFECVSRILAEEGIFQLFRGVLPSIFFTTISLGFYYFS